MFSAMILSSHNVDFQFSCLLQFECSVTVSCEELRQPSDEGDSLLSGHSLNDTQLTTINSHTLTQSPCAQDKHEPDDGFHESHQPMVGPNG